jgi:hypothetical protein
VWTAALPVRADLSFCLLFYRFVRDPTILRRVFHPLAAGIRFGISCTRFHGESRRASLPDDNSYSCSRGHLGSVTSQSDAEKLIAAILQEYPNVPFRIELEPYLLSNVIWASLKDFLDR